MWKKIKNFIIDWIWQLPQNIVGAVYQYYVRGESILLVKDFNERYKVYLKESKGAVSLGRYIFMSRQCANNIFILDHELGHTKQSLILGPLYLIVIGLPSLTWALIHKKVAPSKDYYWFYTEAWANKLAGIWHGMI